VPSKLQIPTNHKAGRQNEVMHGVSRLLALKGFTILRNCSQGITCRGLRVVTNARRYYIGTKPVTQERRDVWIRWVIAERLACRGRSVQWKRVCLHSFQSSSKFLANAFACESNVSVRYGIVIIAGCDISRNARVGDVLNSLVEAIVDAFSVILYPLVGAVSVARKWSSA
jgi:hypothetical protein